MANVPYGPLKRIPIAALSITDGSHLVLFEDSTLGVNKDGNQQYDGSEYMMLYDSHIQVAKIEQEEESSPLSVLYFRFSIILGTIYSIMFIFVRLTNEWPLFVPESKYFIWVWISLPIIITVIFPRIIIKKAGELKVFTINSDPHVLPVSTQSLTNTENILILSVIVAFATLVAEDGADMFCDILLAIVVFISAFEKIWPQSSHPFFVPKGKTPTPRLSLDTFYQKVMNNLQEKRHEDKSDYAELLKLLMLNESPILEYKASLWTNYIGTTDELVKGQLKKNWELQDAVVKTVAAFINTDGGTLLIGVLDKPRSAGDEIAQVVGISPDFQWLNKKRADEEGFTHSMIQLLNDAFGSTSLVKLHVDISTPSYDGNILCRVEVKPRQRERNNDVWVKTKTMGDEEFFFRSSDTTTHASAKSAHNYIRHHFEGFSGENNNTGT